MRQPPALGVRPCAIPDGPLVRLALLLLLTAALMLLTGTLGRPSPPLWLWGSGASTWSRSPEPPRGPTIQVSGRAHGLWWAGPEVGARKGLSQPRSAVPHAAEEPERRLANGRPTGPDREAAWGVLRAPWFAPMSGLAFLGLALGAVAAAGRARAKCTPAPVCFSVPLEAPPAEGRGGANPAASPAPATTVGPPPPPDCPRTSELLLPRRAVTLGAAAGGAWAVAAPGAALASPASPAPGIPGGPLPLTVGLGTCLVKSGFAEDQVLAALALGYRVFDTAQRYKNEPGVGRALQKAFRGGLRREDVFVTTKVWPDNYGYDACIKSVMGSLQRLQLEYVDCLMPHWPGVAVGRDPEVAARNRQARQETWRALEWLQAQGKVRHLGVGNYNERHLRELLGYARVRPAISQFEVHPYNARSDLVQFCQAQGIQVNSYSPLGGKGNKRQVTDELLQDPVVLQIGAAYGKTAAQVILRWHLQRGLVPIPKSLSKKHLQENMAVFDFELSETDVRAIQNLDRGAFVILDSEYYP